MSGPAGPQSERDAVAVRVAIVDDHPMFRMGLAVAIAEMAGIEVVGEAQRADEVAALVSSADPTSCSSTSGWGKVRA
jgi:hypothetical protein